MLCIYLQRALYDIEMNVVFVAECDDFFLLQQMVK